ncbi:hypothetical protein AAFF_G00169970 [Aldrovandia affinis]|uniref:Uncharacterized protein n=1 Tax=Aldrovandia affinis TaxID=143900 RepID=A0AAD7RM74_9TELE|nr:hypothetical protein AAFF_G00169970 [Aldrovandia affinis]
MDAPHVTLSPNSLSRAGAIKAVYPAVLLIGREASWQADGLTGWRSVTANAHVVHRSAHVGHHSPPLIVPPSPQRREAGPLLLAPAFLLKQRWGDGGGAGVS